MYEDGYQLEYTLDTVGVFSKLSDYSIYTFVTHFPH
jgi:hypothetical protein